MRRSVRGEIGGWERVGRLLKEVEKCRANSWAFCSSVALMEPSGLMIEGRECDVSFMPADASAKKRLELGRSISDFSERLRESRMECRSDLEAARNGAGPMTCLRLYSLRQRWKRCFVLLDV